MDLDKLLLTAVSFLRSEENIFPANFVNLKVYGKMFLPIKYGWMADGIAIGGRCFKPPWMIIDIRQMLLPIFWLMLLPWFMTDVIVMVLGQMLLPYICLFYGKCYCHVVLGRCYCQFYVADVKPHYFSTYCNKCDGWCYCLVADGMATAGWLLSLWQMLLPWILILPQF